jgi:hypothetical protein
MVTVFLSVKMSPERQPAGTPWRMTAAVSKTSHKH